MCFYCKDKKNVNIESFVFETIDKLYDHWRSEHSNVSGATEAKSQQPFRFYLVNLLNCQIENCKCTTTFKGLQRHHGSKHPNDLFIPTWNGRCALCLYSGDDLNDHVCVAIENAMQTKLFNPVVLTADDLVELQTIECHRLAQTSPKRFECQYCGGIFDTLHDLTQHHRQQHR